MKKKIIVVMIVIMVILLFPIRFKLKDGGSIEYKALLYKITNVNKLNHYSETGYDKGLKIEILGLEVYNNVVVAKPKNTDIEETPQKYSKIIDNICLELNILSEWQYEELQTDLDNDFYKFALKLYKNNEEKYAVLYFYNNPFGVCGTGRASEEIVLNNGETAIIGYYDGNINWSDISAYNMNKNIAVINYGLIDDEAKEMIEIVKTINIIEDYNEIEVIEDVPTDEEYYGFIGTIIEASDTSIIVEPDEGTIERNSSDKISIGITRPTNGINDFYVKGNKVKITYNGIILETYPAQIIATKIELAN